MQREVEPKFAFLLYPPSAYDSEAEQIGGGESPGMWLSEYWPLVLLCREIFQNTKPGLKSGSVQHSKKEKKMTSAPIAHEHTRKNAEVAGDFCCLLSKYLLCRSTILSGCWVSLNKNSHGVSSAFDTIYIRAVRPKESKTFYPVVRKLKIFNFLLE